MHPGIPLTIRFARPGFFVNDPRLAVWFDRHPIYDGSFLSGFETTFPVAPGEHTIAVRLVTPLFSRDKLYTFTISPANGCRVELEYSRLWGNFTSSPRIQAY